MEVLHKFAQPWITHMRIFWCLLDPTKTCSFIGLIKLCRILTFLFWDAVAVSQVSSTNLTTYLPVKAPVNLTNVTICARWKSSIWCDRCLWITKRSKGPSHCRYLIWVFYYIPYMGLAVFSFAITRIPVYTAISNFKNSCSQRFEVEVVLNSTNYSCLLRGRMAHCYE